jgi:outer membrane protein assembly factor BamB
MARPHQAPLLLSAAGLLAGLACLAAAPAADTAGSAPRAPFLERAWAQPTVREEQTRNWLDKQVLPYLEQRGQPVMPATVPLAVKDLVLFRSHWGVHAVNLRTGKLEWESDSRWSVDRMLRDPGKTGAVDFWLKAYLQANQPAVILDNSLVGSLSSDGRRLFAVEDFQVAPFRQQNGNADPSGGYGPGMSDAVQHSRLQAFDLLTGKLIWELGARHDRDDAPPAADAADLAGSYFLAAPLVLDGKLYVLNEKDSHLRLACLEPATGAVRWLQDMASFRTNLAFDAPRRMRAASLAYADGVLVCPTNAGILLALDLHTRTLLWSHAYREPPPVPPENEEQALRLQLLEQARARRPARPFHWKFCPPLIQSGKVLFTPPDGDTLLCLDLRDGSPLWEVKPKPDDLYLAGVFPGRDRNDGEGRVLIVGKKSCRALSLAEGKPLWTLETGLPSGRGAADGQVYYLPLKEDAATGEPGVVALDVQRGRAVAHVPSPKKEVPGTLAFHDGQVVSQTATEVVVYPQLSARLRDIDGRLGKDPHDVRALLERGELKLTEGDRAGSVADLHAALAAGPPAELRDHVQASLFAALGELLQRDFAAGEKYLGEYEKLCRVDVPGDATPRERQERLDLDVLAAGGDEAFTSPDDPAVRVSRAAWAGAHLAGLLASAAPADRRKLDEEVLAGRRTLESGTDLDALRHFARALGDTPAGRPARWLLAERLAKENAFLGAELVLRQLRRQAPEPAEAGRAVEALARLYADKGLFEDAAACYRELARDYPRTTIRDGKTGKELRDAAATDLRLAPFMEEPDPTPPGKIKVEAGLGNHGRPDGLYTFEPVGTDVPPFFRRHRLTLDVSAARLRLLDRVTNEERWAQDLPRTSFGNLINGGNPQAPFHPRCHVAGHLVVVNLGHLVFGLDPVDRRVLWDKSLLGPLEGLSISGLDYDAQDGTPVVVYQDGWQQRVDQAGLLGAGAVGLQTRGGLIALDPVTGNLLWSRADVPARTRFLSGEQDLVVIEEDADGRPAGTRAFRGADGASLPVRDCSARYPGRVGAVGTSLLLGDGGAGKEFVLHRYDIVAGKDVWEKRFPAGTRPLHSDDPALTGAVEPDGRVTVLDAASGRRVCNLAVNPKDWRPATQVLLFDDRAQFYVATRDPESPQPGLVLPHVTSGSGLRMVRVNGTVYAFDRATGEENWESKAPHQALLMDQFAESPVLFFAARQLRQVVNNGNPAQAQVQGVVRVRAIGKRTGKLVYDELALNNVQPFHTLNRTANAGSVEVLSGNFRIAFTLER